MSLLRRNNNKISSFNKGLHYIHKNHMKKLSDSTLQTPLTNTISLSKVILDRNLTEEW